jgi:hypothetical protein
MSEVEAHIQTCTKCREKLAAMQQRVAENLRASDSEKVNVFKIMKRQIFKRNVITAVIAGILAIGLVAAVGSYVFLHDTAIAYETGLVKIEKRYTNVFKDGNQALHIISADFDNRAAYTVTVLDVTSSKKTFCRYATNRIVERNGENVNVIYMLFSETISTRWSKSASDDFTRIFQPQPDEEPYVRTEVYYLNASLEEYREITKIKDANEFDGKRRNATLIWSGDIE